MSDHAVIQEVLSGNVEAFSRLVDGHYDRSVRIALRILGNREDAEEAVQDAFLRAFRALDGYEDRERFSAWLTRILVNQCRTMLARAQKREAVFSDLDLNAAESLVERDGDEASWPDLGRALAQLSPDQREAVVLRYSDDLTYDEMARITGVGESALKMRVQRAFGRLRALLEGVPNV
ncbi:MAG: polymerase sigma factor, sigma-70 family [Gemmatimonadetes bacterium]|nr:polymerase sigma factor, sigma-70 family [Gemmatimonadota bacterium]